ncbi:MAG: acyltransferase family protein [Maricaulaceae bacterium]
MSIESMPIPRASFRLHFVQALRGIAALLVVLSHIYNEELKHSADHLLGAWAKFGMAGVDLFFVISGFIMVYVTWKLAPSVRNILRFIFGRVSRIYPLYWVITAAIFTLYLICPDAIFGTPRPAGELWKSIVLWPSEGPLILIVGWTLVHELYFYLIFAVLLALPHRFRLVGLSVWGVATLGVLMLGGMNFGPVGKLVFSPYNFEFLAGALAAWIYRSRPDFCHWKWGLIAAFCGLALGTFWLKNMPIEPHIRALVFGVPSAFLIWALTHWEAKGQTPFGVLVRLGDWSYSLYLSHVIIVVGLGRLWAGYAQDGRVWDNAVFIGLSFGACIAVSTLVYRFAEAPLLKAATHAREKLFPRA